MPKDLREYTKEELLDYIKTLKRAKKFGLVWEDKPEQVVDDVASKLPVLEEVSDRAIIHDTTQPTHLIIEGDNYHSLSTLNYTHAGSVDVIYIDPPYNTGNKDFIYNDNYVDKEDVFKHSKWLSFMSKRLLLSRDLLTDDGVIFISIGEDEYAELKLLCDQIFGSENYVTNFLWEKTQHFGRQKVNFYSNGDFILCYAKQLYKSGSLKELLVEYEKTEFEDAPLYNASNPRNELLFPAGTVKFNIADGVYENTTDEKYTLLDKVTVKNGKNTNDLRIAFKSRWSPKKIIDESEKGTTYWVKSDKFAVRAIYADGKQSNESPKQVLFTNRNNEFVSTSRFGIKIGTNEEGSSELTALVGSQNIFNYPKPKSLISYLVSLYFRNGSHPKDITVLDFFAGSGTTGHAVADLNNRDGGTRQFILCTNNENTIAENVTYQRLLKVSESIPSNIRYLKTDFVDRQKTNDQTRLAIIDRSADLIKVRENAFELLIDDSEMKVYKGSEHLAVIMFEVDDIAGSLKRIEALGQGEVVHLYMFSLSNYAYQDELIDTTLDITACPIPESVLEVYQRIFRKAVSNV